MKKETEIESREIPESGEVPEPFFIPGPMLNLMITAQLGFRAELFDGTVRMWPKDCEHPDDTNWLLAPDFANDLDASMELFESLNIQIELEEDFTGMWSATLIAESGMIETAPETTQERAAAFALLSAIAVLNGNFDSSHE